MCETAYLYLEEYLVVPRTSHVSSMARTETTGIAVHFSHARHLPSGSIHNPDLYTLLAPRNLLHSSSPYVVMPRRVGGV